MTTIKSLATITGLLLVMSTMLTTSGIAHAGSFEGLDHGKARTQLTLDSLPGCTNSKPVGSGRASCTADVFVGDDVTLSGKLMTADGEDMPHKSIKIYAQIPAPEAVLLVSAVTGSDGSYEVTWNVKLPDFKQTYQETVKKDLSQTLSIFAVFEGDEELGYTKSNIQGVSIKAKDLITTISADKTEYGAGERAVIFIGFVEGDIAEGKVLQGDFVDPTIIKAIFDNTPVELEKKKEGSYVFITPNLTKQHHQLFIMPEKEGFNANAAYYTIVVEGLR